MKSPPLEIFDTPVQYRREAMDLELTNRCNALCTFCPRDKTPAQGFMSDAHFYKALEAAEKENIFVSLTGQGEPLIHPNFIEYLKAIKNVGLKCQVTTNASLLTETMTKNILSVGLDKINFSVSNLWSDYDSVYNLSFEKTIKNIKYFLDANKNKCEVRISIVKNKENENKHRQLRDFWMGLGINKTHIEILRQTTRAGACKTDDLFVGTDKFRDEARRISKDHGIVECIIPFAFPAIGWDGDHYLCCHDYEKKDPLGSIDQISLIDINDQKQRRVMDSDHSICRKCTLDPVSEIQEVLLQIENKAVTEGALQLIIKKLKKRRLLAGGNRE